jgi:hypothetical protein
MRKRTDTRLWISIIASAFVLPMAAMAFLAFWFTRLYFSPPTITVPIPAELTATGAIPPARAQVEAAVVPPLDAVAEPAAPPPVAQTPEPVPTMPARGNAPTLPAEPVQHASTADSSAMLVEPAAEALSPQPKQRSSGMTEAAASQPDAKASESGIVLPAIAAPAESPPVLRNTIPADTDPARDASLRSTPVMPTEPAALEPSRPIEGPIALPRPRPHIILADVISIVPLPRPRPVKK